MTQKEVLITGCSSGIGLALAARIEKDENKSQCHHRNLGKGEALVEAAGRTLGRTLAIKQLDVCDGDSIRACVDSLPQRRVDVLSKRTFCNAGMGLIGPIECQSIDEMKTVMDTNFFGFVRLLKEILPDMKRRKKGHIVLISSVMGIQVQALRFNLNISLIETGPVITEFERKVYDEGMKTDLSKADKITLICSRAYSQDHHHGNPPFRHQTNTLYTPMTTLKYAEPNGDLPIDTFYKMVFEHEKLFNASLNFLKLLRWRSRKSFAMETDKSN
ncbi:Retinol dehydrogenase 8 [Dissostichus eleginoides]|uniref:Retinol dehydrogenase 8 n=1 Tax=Dissostichus eleginoides TaxID=100907 RepID=A0AAD9C8X9_DISEL|nr:Retinol dehydrogenase 8 [Dissostichus eleginoides]